MWYHFLSFSSECKTFNESAGVTNVVNVNNCVLRMFNEALAKLRSQLFVLFNEIHYFLETKNSTKREKIEI